MISFLGFVGVSQYITGTTNFITSLENFIHLIAFVHCIFEDFFIFFLEEFTEVHIIPDYFIHSVLWPLAALIVEHFEVTCDSFFSHFFGIFPVIVVVPEVVIVVDYDIYHQIIDIQLMEFFDEDIWVSHLEFWVFLELL